LGEAEMLRKTLATIAAAIIMVTAFAVPPAGKREKNDIRKKRCRLRLPLIGSHRAGLEPYDTFLYDSNGMPYGPYCH
jgi:hypothetical protein